MDFFVCAYGEPGEEAFIPYIENYVAGVELQNWDRKGVVSDESWTEVLEAHRALIPKLPGRLAVHGPYEGITFTHKDHLLKSAVRARMDRVYEMVGELRPNRLVMHTGCSDIMVRFGLTEAWLDATADFWRAEMGRYAALGTQVVLENVIEQEPDQMIALVDRVGSDHLGLCLDVGHAAICSPLTPDQWVLRMGSRLKHVHLHDNQGQCDDHLPVGRGCIDMDSIFSALKRTVPDVTVSLEVIDEPDAVVKNLIYVIERYK